MPGVGSATAAGLKRASARLRIVAMWTIESPGDVPHGFPSISRCRTTHSCSELCFSEQPDWMPLLGPSHDRCSPSSNQMRLQFRVSSSRDAPHEVRCCHSRGTEMRNVRPLFQVTLCLVIAIPKEITAPTRLPWPKIVWFGALWIALFFQVIVVMAKEWASDESMGHGFFVPLVAGYIVWQRRGELVRIEPRPHWFGCVIVAFGFVCLTAGLLGADFFATRIGLLATLYGILLSTVGMPVIRALAFPLLLLLFMIRIPLFIYSQITLPLQIFASSVAEIVLTLVGIPVLREGNVLELPSQRLSVVEACSGIRSLISLSFLSLVYGYFFENNRWIRIALFLSTIPIAIFANALRVALTGILSEVNTKLAEGVYHSLEGWVIFMIALVSLLATHRIFTSIARRIARNHPSASPAAKEE